MTEDRGQKTENRKTEDRKVKKEYMANTIKSVKDLKVYCLSYELALKIFNLTKGFPKEETYSLTDQLRRSSRSVSSNIREGYAKRKYENIFIRHLIDAIGSAEESRTWIDFSKDFNYISIQDHENFSSAYDEVVAMLSSLIKKWHTF